MTNTSPAITGQTNVISSHFSAGAVGDIARDLGRFIVTAMEPPWQLAGVRLGAEWITALMDRLGLCYHPVDFGIARETLVASLRACENSQSAARCGTR